VVDDYGAVGQGASNAHWVLVENGSEYITKGPAYTPDHPHVAANEIIAASLAEQLGLPLLDHRVVSLGTSQYFASSWMVGPSFYPAITAQLLADCVNRDRIYDLVALDIWIANGDRHAGNLVARKTPRGNGLPLLLLNDHSHCLVLPKESGALLAGRVNSAPMPYVALDFVRAAVTDIDALRASFDAIEAIAASTIQDAVRSVPVGLMPRGDDGLYRDFLLRRQAAIRQVTRANIAMFPNISGTAL
jgi:hypothetical protein